MQLNKNPRNGSILAFPVDVVLAGLGFWLVVDRMGVITTALFIGINVATLFLFRNPVRGDLRVHTQPWALPMHLVWCSALFAWPALQVIGLERAGWAIVNLAALVIVRTLISIGTIRAGEQRR